MGNQFQSMYEYGCQISLSIFLDAFGRSYDIQGVRLWHVYAAAVKWDDDRERRVRITLKTVHFCSVFISAMLIRIMYVSTPSFTL